MTEYNVYGLREKGCDEIRYVGVTKEPLQRLYTHRAGASRWGDERLAEWIESNHIEMVILEKVNGRRKGRRTAEKWLRTCTALGFDLLNERAESRYVMTPEERVQYAIEWLDKHDIAPHECPGYYDVPTRPAPQRKPIMERPRGPARQLSLFPG